MEAAEDGEGAAPVVGERAARGGWGEGTSSAGGLGRTGLGVRSTGEKTGGGVGKNGAAYCFSSRVSVTNDTRESIFPRCSRQSFPSVRSDTREMLIPECFTLSPSVS